MTISFRTILGLCLLFTWLPCRPGHAAKGANENQDQDAAGRAFYKGDLSSLGVTELYNPNNAVTVEVGGRHVDGTWFLTLNPQLDLHFLDDDLHFGFEVPLALTIFDAQNRFEKLGHLRKPDWDEFSDYAKIIKRIQYGRKEDHLYIHLSKLAVGTIGHGTLIRRHNPNLERDKTRLSLQFDAYFDYAGFQAYVSDLLFQSPLIGGLAFLKPGSFFSDHYMAKSLSIGYHFAFDPRAPGALARTSAGAIVADDTGTPQVSAVIMWGMGVDMEVKFLRIGNEIDLKAYGDYSWLKDGGGCFTLGVLGRFNLAHDPLHAIRARVAMRTAAANYIPTYFDTFYEIQKYQFISGKASSQVPTKYEQLQQLQGDKWTVGGMVDVTYAFVDMFAIGMGVDDTQGEGNTNFFVHLEMPAFEYLQLFASYHKLNFDGLSSLFKLEANELLYCYARLKILPVLIVNGRVQRTFRFDPEEDSQRGSFNNVWDWQVDVEVGWEF